jgi:hypothetical protein
LGIIVLGETVVHKQDIGSTKREGGRESS